MTEEPNRDAYCLRRVIEQDATASSAGSVDIRPPSFGAMLESPRPDIGERLEEEALRRIAANSRGERVEILAKRLPANAKLIPQLAFLVMIVVIELAVPAFYFQKLWIFALLLPFLLCFGPSIVSLLRYNCREHRPSLTFTIEGIELCVFPHNIGLIRWSEIRNITAHNRVKQRFFGIVPNDTAALCRRLSFENAWTIRANANWARFVYRPPHQVMAPISVPQRFFAISADELVAQIDAFRRKNNV